MAITRFTLDDLTPSSWKNGGGETREIVCWPPLSGLEHFNWRASVATISADGPFSTFPGVDRTLVLLGGDGIRLKGPEIDEWVNTPLQTVDFSGDLEVQCGLLGGTSTDFNLMVRRGWARAVLSVVTEPIELERVSHGLLLTVEGQWRVSGGTLRLGQGVWWADQSERWRLTPASRGARLLTVCLWPQEEDF